jgi:GTP1/Obg family GTP-binding protein
MGSTDTPGSYANGQRHYRHETREPKSGLKGLLSEEEQQLLNVIDEVRDMFGSSQNIDLPQLVVCGDQSSGKSSVLEAISEIPFPRGEGTCTRFVTE